MKATVMFPELGAALVVVVAITAKKRNPIEANNFTFTIKDSYSLDIKVQSETNPRGSEIILSLDS